MLTMKNRKFDKSLYSSFTRFLLFSCESVLTFRCCFSSIFFVGDKNIKIRFFVCLTKKIIILVPKFGAIKRRASEEITAFKECFNLNNENIFKVSKVKCKEKIYIWHSVVMHL